MNTAENTAKPGTGYTLLIFMSVLLTLAAVVLSAYMRLSTNGLGCADWPDCYGYVTPPEQHQAAAALSEAGAEMPLRWARVVHRVAATVLGVFIVMIALIALRRRTGGGVALPLLALVLTVGLSALGYVTPAAQLPAVTLGNLAGGMALLGLLWWMGQRSVADAAPPSTPARQLRPWAALGLVIVFAQIGIGAWTSANYAGLGCTELLGCSGWASAGALGEGFSLLRHLEVDAAGKIVLDDATRTIHMVHRLSAALTFLYIGWLGWRALGLQGRYRLTGAVMLGSLLLLVAQGIIAIAASLPLMVVTAHNAVAAVLLLAVVNLNHLLTVKNEL